MNRGEIWTVAGGVYASKPRPALIVQDDLFAETDSVIVIPLTTNSADAPIARIPIAADATTGIAHDSFAMVDKVTAVRRTNLGSRLGRASSSTLIDIERSMIIFLGLGG